VKQENENINQEGKTMGKNSENKNVHQIGKIGSDQILLQFCREIDKAIL
jgi:hypothetical protein